MNNIADVVEVCKAMGQFMTQTNQMLLKLSNETGNLKIDIERLEKKIKWYGKRNHQGETSESRI